MTLVIIYSSVTEIFMYSNNYEYTIEAHCPWHDHQKLFGPPNVNWCEPTICSWINEPFNAWSNLSYILVALWILFYFKNSLHKKYAYIVLFTGLVSFIYHSTNNFLTQYIDFLGMLALLAFVIAFNTLRAKAEFQKINTYFVGSISFLFILLNLFLVLKIPIQMIVAFGCAFIIAQEVKIYFKGQKNYTLWFFILSLALLTLGQVFALLDHRRIYCPAQLWISGHVLWHIFGGLALGVYALHLKAVTFKK